VASKPPKVSIDALAASVGSAIQAAGDFPDATANQITGPWRMLTTVIGQSGPAYVNHTALTLRALKRYGG
jgi:hypothetical protein